MNRRTVLGLLVLALMGVWAAESQAADRYSYGPARRDNYGTYYRHFKVYPYPNSPRYVIHACQYLPRHQPRYVYYYNYSTRVYWGRYDLEQQGYSLLSNENKKASLSDIPESAFPAPGELPLVPGSDDLQLPAPPPLTE